ncbi:MAG TPA: hypothetical protein PK680_04620 [Novosphingobium sp.]|nr:hypothetical protein [Novosphingobium sp.]HQA17650.1 hypothetical protein [Novosphingobium sp.]
MQVSKTLLAIGLLIILTLTASVAYLLGKSASTPAAASTKAAKETDASPALELTTAPATAEANLSPPAPTERKVSTPKPYSKTFTAPEQRLIDAWFHAEELCRGSSEESVIKVWCPRRDAAMSKMNNAGICYGRESDQSAAEYDVHHCGPDSYR